MGYAMRSPLTGLVVSLGFRTSVPERRTAMRTYLNYGDHVNRAVLPLAVLLPQCVASLEGTEASTGNRSIAGYSPGRYDREKS